MTWGGQYWGVAGPATPSEVIDAATKVTHDLAYLGQVTPVTGTDVLIPSAGASAGNTRDNGLLPSLAVDAEFLYTATNDDHTLPNMTALDIGLGNALFAVVGYVAPLLNAANLAGKRGGAGNPGWELGWGAAGMLAGTVSDGVTPAVASVTAGQADGNIADGRRHACVLAILRTDLTAGPNGTLYVGCEAGMSLPTALPPGPLTSPTITASIGQNRVITHAGLRISHFMAASGPALSAMAAGGLEAVRDYVLSLYRLVVNSQAMSELRADWFLPSATVKIADPVPAPLAIDATPVPMDMFDVVPSPLTTSEFLYDQGFQQFLLSPGTFDVGLTMEGEVSGPADVDIILETGYLLTTTPIVLGVDTRKSVSSGSSNIVTFSFLFAKLAPPRGSTPDPLGILLKMAASASRTFQVTATDGTLASRGRTPAG